MAQAVLLRLLASSGIRQWPTAFLVSSFQQRGHGYSTSVPILTAT